MVSENPLFMVNYLCPALSQQHHISCSTHNDSLIHNIVKAYALVSYAVICTAK